MNPYSKVDELDITNIKDSDQTVIYFIKVIDLSLNDIFIDDHGHFWSITKELSLFPKEKNPLTNSPFEPTEWERIEKAINWNKENSDVKIKYNKRQIVPLPQNSMSIQPQNSMSIQPTRRQRNFYLTPVHGKVDGNFYCFPFFSKDLTGCKICEGDGNFHYNNEVIHFNWTSPFIIRCNNSKCLTPCCTFVGGSNSDCFYDTCLMPCCGIWQNQRNTGCFLIPGYFSYQSSSVDLTTFLGLFTNYNNNCYTPISCCNKNYSNIVSIFGCKTKNCGISPILCQRKNLCCLLGIPICKV
jgi:hypothetical protein